MARSVDPQLYTAGSSSLVLGCDSYTSPTELGDTEYVSGQNVVCRGGIVQTRPGSRSLFCLPDGNFQGYKLFTPDNGVAQMVCAVDGVIYVSAAPFTSYRVLRNVRFSSTAKYIAWAVCLKSTDYDNEGVLFALENPYSVLIMQDGLTRAAYWDGGTSGHLNPGSAPFPDNTDIVPGYNETPIGMWMIWSGNRLWVSRGNQIFAGDIGNPLKFTETLYLNEGRAFNLSSPCTGMIEVPSDQAGAKGFIAFTDSDGTLFASYIQDRTTWLSTPLFQNTILPQIGCVAPRSLVTQYGLNWWFGPRGFTNINSALRQNITSRIDYQDNEMFSSKAYLGPDLSGICASFYENYLMVSVPSADVLNRHTWVLDQAPFESNAAAWPGFWTGWRPIEWSRGLINGSERVFFGSIDYDGKNRVWEAMLPEKTDNGCAITCYAQLRDHAAGNLNQKRYEWSKFFLSQIYGEVDLNIYVASTKGSYQLQKGYHLVANEGQIFADTEYSEEGPLMIGNRVQSRTIRTPENPEDNECNACGVESKEGNMIDYAFSHLLVWSGQMGIRAYQMHMRESPERFGGDCEEPEVGPRTLNAAGCSGLELIVDAQPFDQFKGYFEGVTFAYDGGAVYIRRTVTSSISQINADAMAQCAVEKIIAYLKERQISPGVYETDEAEIGSGTYVIVDSVARLAPVISLECESAAGMATLCGFSEFATPSIPPKKYRKKTLSGLVARCNYSSSANCMAESSPQGSDGYNTNGTTYEYGVSDCAIVRSGQIDVFQDIGLCPAVTLVGVNTDPNFAPTDTVQIGVNTTPTSITSFSKGSCIFSATVYSKVTTTQAATLSVEDTEAAAIARATITPGISCTALRQQRGAGQFSFAFRNVSFELPCIDLIEGSAYRATVNILEENYGGGSPVITQRTWVFVATGLTHTISDTLVPDSGKQLTAQNPVIVEL